MGFLTVICFLILGFYLLQWLLRLWLRARVNRIQREMEKNGGQYTRTNGNSRRERPVREGEVRVETGRAAGKKVSDRIGDYVEYEEIEIVEEIREAN